MYQALNVSFFIFHTAWVIFNAIGWIWRRTRRWHLATVGLTGLSWFGMGPWHGWGYCICTDWHWRVRERLDNRDPSSYMQLLISEILRVDIGSFWADALTGGIFAVVAVLTLMLNLRDRRREHAAAR